MHLLNHEQPLEESKVFPQEMTLGSSKRSTLLTDKEYIELLKDSLSEIANRLNQEIDPLASAVDLVYGAPRNFEVPKAKGVVAQFYIQNTDSFNALIDSLEDGQSTRFAAANVDSEGALVYVRVIKQGNLLYPDVHYASTTNDLGRHIANAFVREVPYLGDINEIDRVREQEKRSKKYLKIGASIGAIGLLASMTASLMSAQSARNIQEVDNTLNMLSTHSLTQKSIDQASKILVDGTIEQKQQALQIIVKWSNVALENPSYIGRTDNTYTGPIFFSRIADRALESETSESIRNQLIKFKLSTSMKGEPVIMRQFEEYALIALSENGMTEANAKAMSWEHIVIPMKKLTTEEISRTEQLKIANQLGAVMFSSSKAIPALRYDYQRSIIPQISDLKDPYVKETLRQWSIKL